MTEVILSQIKEGQTSLEQAIGCFDKLLNTEPFDGNQVLTTLLQVQREIFQDHRVVSRPRVTFNILRDLADKAVEQAKGAQSDRLGDFRLLMESYNLALALWYQKEENDAASWRSRYYCR